MPAKAYADYLSRLSDQSHPEGWFQSDNGVSFHVSTMFNNRDRQEVNRPVRLKEQGNYKFP